MEKHEVRLRGLAVALKSKSCSLPPTQAFTTHLTDPTTHHPR